MKKVIFSMLFLCLFLVNPLSSDDAKIEQLMQEVMKLDKEIQVEKAKTLAEKKESESAKKVGRKLDELKDVLSNWII